MGDDVSLPVHPFLFMAVDTCLCVGRRVIAGSFYFIDDGKSFLLSRKCFLPPLNIRFKTIQAFQGGLKVKIILMFDNKRRVMALLSTNKVV